MSLEKVKGIREKLGNAARAAALSVGMSTGMLAGIPQADARVAPVPEQIVESVDKELRDLAAKFNQQYGGHLGNIELAHPPQMMTGGEIGIYQAGTRNKIGEIRYHQLANPLTQVHELTPTFVAGLILEQKFTPLKFTIGETRVSVTPFAQAMIQLGGGRLDDRLGQLTLPDGSGIQLNGEGSPERNREIKIMGMMKASSPTVLACVWTEANTLEGHRIILGDATTLERMNRDEVNNNCR